MVHHREHHIDLHHGLAIVLQTLEILDPISAILQEASILGFALLKTSVYIKNVRPAGHTGLSSALLSGVRSRRTFVM